MEVQNKKRELWVDYIKALACLSVLTFHVIYGMQNAGLECGQFFVGLKELCNIFQIPTFLFASGYLFGRKPMGNYFKFEGRKLLNLGIPYITFSVVYYVVNVTFSSSVNFSYTPKDLLNIYVSPIAQYWYIFATILIFLVLPLLEKLIQNECMLLIFLVVWKIINTYLISVTNYDYFFSEYAMYFYMGVLYSRHHDALTLKRDKKGTALVVLAGYVAIFSSFFWFDWGDMFAIMEYFMAILSIYLLTFVFENWEDKLGNAFLRVVAKYSFQIYLLHTMVTAATRIVLVKIGIVSQWPQFIIGWILGLSITMLVAFICDKTIVLNIFFFPERTVKQLRERKKAKEQHR